MNTNYQNPNTLSQTPAIDSCYWDLWRLCHISYFDWQYLTTVSRAVKSSPTLSVLLTFTWQSPGIGLGAFCMQSMSSTTTLFKGVVLRPPPSLLLLCTSSPSLHLPPPSVGTYNTFSSRCLTQCECQCKKNPPSRKAVSDNGSRPDRLSTPSLLPDKCCSNEIPMYSTLPAFQYAETLALAWGQHPTLPLTT